MDLRSAAYTLAGVHALDRAASLRLLDLAVPDSAPAGLMEWFWRAVAVLAAVLGGLGLVLWVAANWDTLGRMGRFALLQATVSAMLLGAAALPRLRPPLGLMALLGTGALFAYFGQTYQTGADPWQLFALWALLTLPLCLAARSDLLWPPWALVVATGISLWVQAHTGHRWRVAPEDLPVHLAGWGAAWMLVALLGRRLARFTGAGAWSWRMAATLAVCMGTITALGGLFASEVAPHYYAGLALLLAWGAWMCTARGFEVYGLSAAALGLNALVLGGLGRMLFGHGPTDAVAALLLMGLASAGLLALTVQGILRLARRHGRDPSPARPPEGAGTGAPGREGVPIPSARPPAIGDAAVQAPATLPPDLAALLQEAQAQQLLPADAVAEASEQRPWPVVLLTALGAWLSALPLLGVVGLLLGDLFDRPLSPYLVGALLLWGTLLLLRSRTLPVFVEQLAIPLLLTGAGTLGYGLFRDLPQPLAALLLCAVALGCGVAVGRPWLRVLFGLAAAGLFMLALMPDLRWFDRAPLGDLAFWFAPHAALATWLGALVLQPRLLGTRRGAAAARCLEQIGTGWLLAAVGALAWAAGPTFLVGGALGSGIARDLGGLVFTPGTGRMPLAAGAMATASVLLTLAAGLRLARAWPPTRHASCLGVALVLGALCAFLTTLGAVLLALATAATTRRWKLATACAVAAAWIAGSVYYQLAWPLATKALVLVASGALLAALAYGAQAAMASRKAPVGIVSGHGATADHPLTTSQAGPASAGRLAQDFADTQGPPLRPHLAMPPAARRRTPLALIALCGAAVLLAANIGIRQKETLIAEGQRLFFPLAPVDPRSLMQGDYMRLRFALPAGADRAAGLPGAQRPRLVARRDARGVGTLLRLHDRAQPLADGEFLVELTPKDGGWMLVSDAWFFREGEAARFAQARFGEFRVAADGQALLVGLADASLRSIAP